MACNGGRILHALLWTLLNTTFIGCQQNAVITASRTSLTEGDPLTLTCTYTGIDNESAIVWYNKTVGNFFVLKPNSSMSNNCSFYSKGPSFESSRVAYTCDFTNNIYTLAIALVQIEDGGLWFCTFQDPFPGSPTSNITLQVTATTSTSTTTTAQPTTAPSPLPEIIPPSIVGVAGIVIFLFLFLFCCGCLDCCQLCRIFDHYEVNKFCYVTCYFIKRGCCSFFYCKSGSKRGKCFCGDHKGERCGGCLSCRNKCTCGWPGNCKTTDSNCGGSCICVCCVTARREEEDPLVVCIDNKDAICRPEDDKVTITCSVNGYGPGDTTVTWTGPQGNELTNSTKYNITQYNKDTGKSSLTISPFCSSDNGQYTCQVTDVYGLFVEDSILITVHDTDRNTNRIGSSAAVSREHVELQMERKGVKSGDEERPPAIHVRTQNRVESEPTNKKTSDRPQPLPPVGVVTEDRSKHRPQPSPPDNSDVKDPNKRGISANFDDKQGLPTEPPRSSRLPPLTQKQAPVEEKVASEEKTKKKRKKKKKKDQMNEGNQEDKLVELTSKRTLPEMPEDQSDGN